MTGGTMRTVRLLCVITGVGLVACRPADQRTDGVDPTKARTRLSPSMAAQLDSGTAAFRAHDFIRARTHYLRVTTEEPEEAAGWFGVYMAEKALGNLESADSALAAVRRVAPGATLLRDDPNGS